MPIEASDLYLFASARMTDTTDGGGAMADTTVQDAEENNVFPDVMPSDRVSGRLQLRKVYPAVMTADDDMLSGAGLLVYAQPTDANVDVVAFTYGDAKTLAPAAQTALYSEPYMKSQGWAVFTRVDATHVDVLINVEGDIEVGDRLARFDENDLNTVLNVANVTAIGTHGAESGGKTRLTLSADLGPNTLDLYSLYKLVPLTGAVKACGHAATTGSVSAGATSIALDRVEARVAPVGSTSLAKYSGKVPIFRAGETVLIRDGSGSELRVIARVLYTGGLEFTAPLTNGYASGAHVSSIVSLGDLKAAVGASFSQQTWTKEFSDALIGNGISSNYNRVAGSITTTNEGAATDRWAIVFTSATAFKLFSETKGQVATGAIGTTFAPLNPISNQPYFTITPEGWGSGWSIGNVLRFNTTGALAPTWVARCTSPSSPGGTDQAVMQMRGGVDA